MPEYQDTSRESERRITQRELDGWRQELSFLQPLYDTSKEQAYGVSILIQTRISNLVTQIYWAEYKLAKEL